jgi:hypothetical protein
LLLVTALFIRLQNVRDVDGEAAVLVSSYTSVLPGTFVVFESVTCVLVYCGVATHRIVRLVEWSTFSIPRGSDRFLTMTDEYRVCQYRYDKFVTQYLNGIHDKSMGRSRSTSLLGNSRHLNYSVCWKSKLKGHMVVTLFTLFTGSHRNPDHSIHWSDPDHSISLVRGTRGPSLPYLVYEELQRSSSFNLIGQWPPGQRGVRSQGISTSLRKATSSFASLAFFATTFSFISS